MSKVRNLQHQGTQTSRTLHSAALGIGIHGKIVTGISSSAPYQASKAPRTSQPHPSTDAPKPNASTIQHSRRRSRRKGCYNINWQVGKTFLMICVYIIDIISSKWTCYPAILLEYIWLAAAWGLQPDLPLQFQQGIFDPRSSAVLMKETEAAISIV